MSFKILSFYLFYSLLSDLFLSKLSIKYFSTEIYSFRLFTFVEYVTLTFMLLQQIQSVLFKKMIKFLSIVFIFFLIFDFLTASSNEFDSIPTSIESLSIICISIFLLYEKVLKSNNYFTPFVWISIGLILFFSGTFFLFILSKNNFNNFGFSVIYGYIVAAFKILMYFFISIGIITEINACKIKITNV